MGDEQTGESVQPQIYLSVDELVEKLQMEFYTLSSDNNKFQQEYYAYKNQAEEKLSNLYVENARLRSEVHTTASAVHTIYQEMSEVLLQNQIIAGNNHHLLTDKTELENKLFEVEQSESTLKSLVSAKSIEFSEEKEKLLGELSSMMISNDNLLLELRSRIKVLEEDVQLKKTRNENLQHEVALLQKCDLDFILKKRAATTSRLRRKFYGPVNIINNEKGKKIVISQVKSYRDGEFKSDCADSSGNMEIPPNKNLENSIMDLSIWKGHDSNAISQPFSLIQPLCASSETHVAETIEGSPVDEHLVEVVTLSDSDI